MRPQSTIYLCNMSELSNDYASTYDFDNLDNQKEFFYKRRTMTFLNYTYLRQDNSIKVGVNIDDIYTSNYLYYSNGDKTFYCFITEKEYLNEGTTKLYIETDVIQTYMFDYTILDSFVDSMHVDRWNKVTGYPTDEYEEEGLELGDMIETSKSTIYTYKDNYVIVSSDPMGKVVIKDAGGGGGGGSVCSPLVNNEAGVGWLIPSTGTVTALFGTYPSGGKHDGFDIGNNLGTPVLASKDGTVIVAKIQTDSFGKWIKLDHGNGVHSIYAHNSELLVAEGETVTRGQMIAKSGTTGNSTGVHCHWEIRKDNKPVNPITNGDYKVGDVIDKTGCDGGSNGGDYLEGVPGGQLVRFIKGYEGFGKYLYKDSGGLNTIGYGITRGGNAEFYDDMVANQPVTEEKASRFMFEELKKRGKKWMKQINKYARSQGEFDALLDLAYNGVPDIMNENHSLWVALRTNRDESYIRPIWEKYFISDGSNVQQGLVSRRRQECNMFYGKNVEMRDILVIVGTGQYDGTVKENNGNGWLP